MDTVDCTDRHTSLYLFYTQIIKVGMKIVFEVKKNNLYFCENLYIYMCVCVYMQQKSIFLCWEEF